jgi:hypothetical protein
MLSSTPFDLSSGRYESFPSGGNNHGQVTLLTCANNSPTFSCAKFQQKGLRYRRNANLKVSLIVFRDTLPPRGGNEGLDKAPKRRYLRRLKNNAFLDESTNIIAHKKSVLLQSNQ